MKIKFWKDFPVGRRQMNSRMMTVELKKMSVIYKELKRHKKTPSRASRKWEGELNELAENDIRKLPELSMFT